MRICEVIYLSKNTLRLSLALLAFYVLLSADASPLSLITGTAAALFCARVWSGVFVREGEMSDIPGFWVLAVYLVHLVFEIYKSSFSMMVKIVKNDSSPVAVRVRLDGSNPFIAAAVANSVTLTPGTIAIDVAGDEILVLSAGGSQGAKRLQADIKRAFEKRLKKSLKKTGEETPG